ncbi:hypothetical protein GCM10022393_22160 [Aquimarina addita]|uniref:Multidrug transporter n=1 Tax=Aquimarina addita TaxID=870485 RepID=A0ABP6UN79_9FLAO
MNFKKKTGILALIIGILLILNITSYLNVYNNDLPSDTFFFKKFNFDTEKNFPSVFSSLLHLIASILLLSIGLTKLKTKTKKFFWFSLSVVFLFLALDELLRIHEKIGRYMDTMVDKSGIFYYSWLIPYGIAVILLGILYIKPFFRLPRKTIINFIIAGFIFIMGAMGLEMITGSYIDSSNFGNVELKLIPQIFVLYTIEELLEMIGITFFNYELLRFKVTNKIS